MENEFPPGYPVGHESPFGPALEEYTQSVSILGSASPDTQKLKPDTQTPHEYSTPATSPPTPSQQLDVITTRSGLSIPKIKNPLKPISGKTDRIDKTSQRKRKAKAPRKHTNAKELEAPLSQLGSSPVADIEAYVKRPIEERIGEIETGKNPGKVRRPMNAFMLYRKAYQHRAKEHCGHGNHQKVSQVCGESWPMEPSHIKEQFNQWARIERDNHQKAHPGYKFAPAKPRHLKKKEMDDSDDGSDFDTGFSHEKRRNMTRAGAADSDEHHRPSGFYKNQSQPRNAGEMPINESSFSRVNPGRPVPTPYGQHVQAGRYWQPRVQINNGYAAPYPHVSQVPEDVYMRLTSAPAHDHTAGRYGSEIMAYADPYSDHYTGHFPQQYPDPSSFVSEPQTLESQIDPNLMSTGFSPGLLCLPEGVDDNSAISGMRTGQQWTGDLSGVKDSGFGASLDYRLLQDQHAVLLKGVEDSWQIEQPESGQAADSWAHPQQSAPPT